MGHSTADDAGVYRVRDDLAIVQTVDLFPPVVDDAYDFGRIAAANALSDIYAMGARPLFALSVVGFPQAKLKLEVLGEILRGGQDVAREAGIDIIGGHTLDDAEPKYGLSVTGLVHPDRVWRNQGARPGDVLLLTKPLGTGVLTTAVKQGLLDDQTLALAVKTMATLNSAGADALEGLDVHACTDVTGFGLLGHLGEMVSASGVRAVLHCASVPLLPRVAELAAADVFPGGSRRNLHHAGVWLEGADKISRETALVLADAQTSGGLLAALPALDAERALAALKASGYSLDAAIVGEVVDAHEGGRIRLEMP